MQYVILCTNKYDSYDRYFAVRDNLEAAKGVANAFEINGKYLVQVYELTNRVY